MRRSFGGAFTGVVLIAVAASVLAVLRHRGEGGPKQVNPVGDLPVLQGRVRVEVLNAGGRRGAAHEATELLRKRGFDVVYFGNADSFGQDSSVVLDRVGRPDDARGVADALGIDDVRSDPDPNLYLDVSVMLGREWQPADAAGPKGKRP